jgi:hypothetical protein
MIVNISHFRTISLLGLLIVFIMSPRYKIVNGTFLSAPNKMQLAALLLLAVRSYCLRRRA